MFVYEFNEIYDESNILILYQKLKGDSNFSIS